jgi:hypothetical protein
MSQIKNDFFLGLALSSVPVYVLTKYYFENNISPKDFDFKTIVMYLPLEMGVINVLLFLIVGKFFPDHVSNPIVMGMLMSIILSMITKSFNEIPEKVIKMDNSNMYHIYSMVVFTICYFIIMKLFKN